MSLTALVTFLKNESKRAIITRNFVKTFRLKKLLCNHYREKNNDQQARTGVDSRINLF